MRINSIICGLSLLFVSISPAGEVYVEPTHVVRLPQAHQGTLEVDTLLLDSYGSPPPARREFYLRARAVLAGSKTSQISDPEIISIANELELPLISGPMLGGLTSDGISIWLRALNDENLQVQVQDDHGQVQTFPIKVSSPGADTRIRLKDLSPDTSYTYAIINSSGAAIGHGSFRTAPQADTRQQVRIAFGADFHKIGLHNPNLFRYILARKPLVMLLYGDSAVDGRQANIGMHRADYLLRDVSEPWRQFVAKTPVYATWDDWDYYHNDTSGIARQMTNNGRDNLRAVWHQNWVNPDSRPDNEGIYFQTRIGPVEIFMLDTRSCRENKRKGELASYLGAKQHGCLKEGLRNSIAPFKIISSGTMWSDYVSNGKDSWKPWDPEGREEIFHLIEKHKIGGVLLISGDRHGARCFRIPRESGYSFYEFGIASLGGVKGPKAMAPDPTDQVFGYPGLDTIAFGEFTFDTSRPDPQVTFCLINDHGETLEEHSYSLSQLTPP